MHSARREPRRTTVRVIAYASLCFGVTFLLFGPILSVVRAQEKKLSIYTPQLSYSVSVLDQQGGEYVGLVDILEPLGRVDARVDCKKWTLKFVPAGTSTSIEAQFSDGKKNGKVRGSNFELPSEFTLVSSRGYISVAALPNVLPRLLDLPAQLHQPARRLFIGATSMKYSAELKKNPSRLVISFPSPVSPFVATEPGRLRMVFAKDAVVSTGKDSINFGDPLISSLQFGENNGAAQITLNTTSPVLANFSEGGKVITITAAPQQASAAPPPVAPRPETPLPPPNMGPSNSVPVRPVPSGPKFLVMIDAAHGGDERGALLNESIAEKDVSLAFAKRLYRELEAKGIAATLVRSGDNTLTFDQRAQTANAGRASIFITVHASSMGNGIRLYTALMPVSATPPNRRQFLPWETAQAPFVDLSTQVAGSVAAECNTRKLAVRALPSALRPLNNIAAPAIGVELAPPGDKIEEVNDAKYQQNIAAAITAGIVAIRGKLEVAQP